MLMISIDDTLDNSRHDADLLDTTSFYIIPLVSICTSMCSTTSEHK